jgi:hypothetical protein
MRGRASPDTVALAAWLGPARPVGPIMQIGCLSSYVYEAICHVIIIASGGRAAAPS